MGRKLRTGLTVGELAARLTPIAEDRPVAPITEDPAPAKGAIEATMAWMDPPDTVAIEGAVHEAIVQKIRHWTRERLLSPVGQLHTGTGAYRRFSDTAVYDAAVLYALTGAGFTISAADHFRAALAKVRAALPTWREQGGPLYLVISRNGARSDIEVVEQEPAAATADVLVIVNLSRLFTRIEAKAA